MNSVFFLHLPGNLDLLKKELTNFPGEFRPSFSTPGFITFKVDDRALSALKRQTPSLCLAMGFDAVRVEDLAASVWCEDGELKFVQAKELVFRDPKGNLWHGKCSSFELLSQLANLQQPEQAPSRAWLKIAQACQLFPRDRSGYALEIGCAPGGAAYHLLELGLKLVGVDPGEMAPEIMANERFHHVKKPVQDIEGRDLKHKFSLLAVDTNLPASVSVKESLRLAEYSGKELKEVFLTVKLPTPKLVASLQRYQGTLERLGFKAMLIQLPSHHREILLVGTRR